MWPTVTGEAVPANLETQLRSRGRGRSRVVPMEEREANASRFVSLLAGHTVSDKPPKPSRVVRLLPYQVAHLRRQVEELAQQLEQHQPPLGEEPSAPPDFRWSPTPQGRSPIH